MTTPLTYEQQRILMSALNPARVHTRKQGGATLSFVEAWDIRATLIRVFGFGGFDAEVLEYRIEDIREVPRSSGEGTNFRVTTSARMRLHIRQLGATYTEAAVSSQTGPDLGEVMDFSQKTCVSDALKRCAINLGTQYGLSLYSDGSTSDIVRRVFAPGQEWPREQLVAPDQSGHVTGDMSAPAQRTEEEILQAQARIEAAFPGTQEVSP